MNILIDSACPACERTAVLEMQVDTAAHDAQQLDVIVKCHFCKSIFNQFVPLNEMEVINGL